MQQSLWFSGNPDKAWVEKFFLAYSPVWMAVMGIMMLFGLDKSMNDLPLLLVCCLVALPSVLLPAFLHGKYGSVRWQDRYCL